MKKLSELIFILSLCIISFTECSRKTNISGKIVNTGKKTLYLENIGLNESLLIDSAVLDTSGIFNFKITKNDYPEFYRLRLNNHILNFATTDSTNDININADGNDIGIDYYISTKINQDIKFLSDEIRIASGRVDSLINLYELRELSHEEFNKEIGRCSAIFKRKAMSVILHNPKSPASYYALFQKVHNTYIFNPNNKIDSKFFGAVATSWNVFYPKIKRTKHLVNLTLQGITKIREERDKQED